MSEDDPNRCIPAYTRLGSDTWTLVKSTWTFLVSVALALWAILREIWIVLSTVFKYLWGGCASVCGAVCFCFKRDDDGGDDDEKQESDTDAAVDANAHAALPLILARA
tara:strand:+ start:612 stop:935 length:324 start_codon:yes stop_codon:yes gene_type:complete